MSNLTKSTIDVKWDATIKCVHTAGNGYIEGQFFRDNMDKGLIILKENRGFKWLADMRLQSVLPIADQDWTVQDWTPRSVKAGIKYCAFVVPTNVLGQMSLKRITSRVGDKEITMAYFDSVEEAKEWLKTF